jgi:uncharacterized protein (DUF2237 family)
VLRDDRAGGGRRPAPARNVLGEALEICSIKPMTGFLSGRLLQYRGRGRRQPHGLCRDDRRISGIFQIARKRPVHTDARARLSRAEAWRPLVLVCPRWQEALEANRAPRVVLRATHEGALTYCSLANLKRLAVDLS